MRLYLVYAILFFSIGCSVHKNDKISIKQGVRGTVIWKEGNFQPTVGQVPNSQSKPVVRTLVVYQLTNLKQTRGEAPLFSAIKSSKIKKIKSGRDGRFAIDLKPGFYSIFSLETDNKLFANRFDGEGNISPFEVKAGEVKKMDIIIDYKANY